MTNLFSSTKIRNIKIKNRVVMPPMVCFGWANNTGMVTENHIRHYEARAAGGVGVIIIEATCVNKNGRLADSQLGIWSDEHIEGFRKIAESCHKYNTVVLIQIHHAGLQTPESVTKPAVSSSNYSDGKKNAVALSIEEIHLVQRNFVEAAIRAKKAGLDGIELHGAHGYLIDQFASPIINKREDEYGGTTINRMRFASEIIGEIKRDLDEEFIIGYRMGGNEPTLKEGVEIARILESAGVDLLHVSAGISSGELPKVPANFAYNWIVYVGTEIKKHVNIPVIVVNGIKTPEQASFLIENNFSDFTAIGKGMLVDSHWTNKALCKDSVKPCLRCKKCYWFIDGKLCPQNS